MYPICDAIMLQWVMSGNHFDFILKHFFTRMMNLESDLSFIQFFSRKSIKKLRRDKFVVELWRIDIMCAQTNKPRDIGEIPASILNMLRQRNLQKVTANNRGKTSCQTFCRNVLKNGQKWDKKWQLRTEGSILRLLTLKHQWAI